MSYEIVIRGGVVVDGSGSAPFRADVGVVNGRIAEVGRIDERGATELDAEGHVVTPGFIDGHTHMDAQIFWDPIGSSSCFHGVTTAVMGNCGFTLAPALPSRRDLVVRNLERAEDISAAAMAEGIDWTWETFPEWLDAVDRLPKGINYLSNIGHSALRTWAMGERAFEAEANDDDLAIMKRQLEAALRSGAVGFTTSRSGQHRTSDDRPVASRMASWGEVCELVDVVRVVGGGIFELAVDERIRSLDPADRETVAREIADLAISSGVPVTFGIPAGHVGTPDLLQIVARGNASGGRVIGQTHSRGISVILSFKTTLPFDRLDSWKTFRSADLDSQRRVLSDPDARSRLVAAARNGKYSQGVGTEVRPPDYDNIFLFDAPLPPYRSVAAVAHKLGVDPVELMITRALDSDFSQLFLQPLVPPTEEQLLGVMNHPGTVMTFSDSGAHVSQIIDSSIQSHLLAYWVRERAAYTLEAAVHMLTNRPASAWNLQNRGLVKVGYHADLNVFDPCTVGPKMPTVEYDLPAGAKRLKQTATGFLATIVAGRPVLLSGQPTGQLPGRLLRGASNPAAYSLDH